MHSTRSVPCFHSAYGTIPPFLCRFVCPHPPPPSSVEHVVLSPVSRILFGLTSCLFCRYPEASDPGPRRISAVAKGVSTNAAAEARLARTADHRGPQIYLCQLAANLAGVLQIMLLERFVQLARVGRATYDGEATDHAQIIFGCMGEQRQCTIEPAPWWQYVSRVA